MEEQVSGKTSSRCFTEAESQRQNPQFRTAAMKNSLLTERNLEQDQAYKEEPSCSSQLSKVGKEGDRTERNQESEIQTSYNRGNSNIADIKYITQPRQVLIKKKKKSDLRQFVWCDDIKEPDRMFRHFKATKDSGE